MCSLFPTCLYGAIWCPSPACCAPRDSLCRQTPNSFAFGFCLDLAKGAGTLVKLEGVGESCHYSPPCHSLPRYPHGGFCVSLTLTRAPVGGFCFPGPSPYILSKTALLQLLRPRSMVPNSINISCVCSACPHICVFNSI